MNANFIEVDSIDSLNSLFERSHASPVVLFKHSTTCGISAGVLREVSSVDGDIHMIVMQTHRPLSNALAERTGVRHESPQAIVLKDGMPVYTASHYDIEPRELQSFLTAESND
jgi:bacillithiol system protein YtxJ